jgi:sulfite exporter TauE/SafE
VKYPLYRSGTHHASLSLDLTFFTALTIGLLGSTHCIGMCGGIVGALNVGLPQSRRQSRLPRMMHHLTYNTGRIMSYTLAGALAGLIGAQATRFSAGAAIPIGRVIAGLLMIALGLYLAGWWHGIRGIEKAGLHIWRVIEPMGRRFTPSKNPLHVFGLGLVWGWLPCGLVYSALALAMTSASPQHGALLMLGFGLGTLPMLLAMGTVAGQLRKIMQHTIVRRITGTVILLFGAYTCVTAFNEDRHHHSAANNCITGHEAVSTCPEHYFDYRSLDQVRYLV